jgi:serine/threonine-protein kinase
MLLKPGDIIGDRDRYEIVDYVNEGGMQEVYRATDHVLRREVAVKVPKNATAVKRFHRSAVVSARINHPNVAKTFDYVDGENHPYLVEEYVDGSDLQLGLLQRFEALDPYLVAKILHRLARGVRAAHEVGVVHRDLKPSNVLFSGLINVDELKISDFGIAKMAQEELAEAVEGGQLTMGRSKTLIGALPYMSPEMVADPHAANEPADIWSLGAMIYELLSGETPYGSSLTSVPKILEAAPVPEPKVIETCRQLAPLARELIAIVHDCLQKDPDVRPTASDLVRVAEQLCYSMLPRYRGRVRTFLQRTYGFIESDGEDHFFHVNSVYGPRLRVGDEVVFSKTPGGAADNAFPIIKLKAVGA